MLVSIYLYENYEDVAAWGHIYNSIVVVFIVAIIMFPSWNQMQSSV